LIFCIPRITALGYGDAAEDVCDDHRQVARESRGARVVAAGRPVRHLAVPGVAPRSSLHPRRGKLGPVGMGRWTAALSFLSGAVEPVAARLRPHTEVLARRWRTVAGGAAGAVVLASLACVVVPSRYTATARLHVEPLTPKAVQTSQGVEVSEEVGLLGSRILVAEVIRQLGLDRDPDFVNARRRVGWLGPATRALKRLRTATRPARDSQEDADADERLLLDVPGALLAAEGALAEFRREHPTIALDGRQQTLATRLTELGRRLGEAEADRIAAESEHRLARSRSYDGLPAVASNPRIQALRAEANRLETRHAELRKSFLAASPEFHDIS